MIFDKFDLTEDELEYINIDDNRTKLEEFIVELESDNTNRLHREVQFKYGNSKKSIELKIVNKHGSIIRSSGKLIGYLFSIASKIYEYYHILNMSDGDMTNLVNIILLGESDHLDKEFQLKILKKEIKSLRDKNLELNTKLIRCVSKT